MSEPTGRDAPAEPASTVLITGGATGIGRACAFACGRAGAIVALLSLPGQDLSRTAGELGAAGIQVYPAEADVRDFGAVERAAGQIVADLGRIDVLIASAGIADQSSITSGSPDRKRASESRFSWGCPEAADLQQAWLGRAGR